MKIEVNNQFNSFCARACLAFWDEDGALMPPSEPIVQGIEAMRPWYVRRFGQVNHGVDIHFDDIQVSELWSMAQGRFVGSFIPKDGARVSSLKFYRHMWSSDLP